MRILRVLGFIATLIVPQPVADTTLHQIVVYENYGGLLDQFNATFTSLEATGLPVIIKGRCMSACARFMKLKHVCAAKDAQFGFHAVRDAKTDILLPELGRKDALEHQFSLANELEERYGAFEFGFVNGPIYLNWIPLEPGVALYFHYTEQNNKPVYQEFLMVKANKLIPDCKSI